ncbi:MAG: Eco57I restriction-modification methylase domain-containing protein [Candidatus Hodarchaeota archaeon]
MVYKHAYLVEKKQKGQYFTNPIIAKKIVKEICDRLLYELFWSRLNSANDVKEENLIASLLKGVFKLKFVDPAMGEGVFLVELLNYFEEFLTELSITVKFYKLEDKISTIFRREYGLDFLLLVKDDPITSDIWKLHILRSMLYGVDLDKRIVHKARKRLVECFFSPSIIKLAELFCKLNLKQGNSLISPIAADANLKNTLSHDFSKIVTLVLDKRKQFQKVNWKNIDLQELEVFSEREYEFKEELVSQILNRADPECLTFSLEQSAFIWEIEFPEVFFSSLGGFDVVLGNPPWDKWKLYDREWLGSTSLSDSNYAQKISKIRLSDSQANQDYLTLKQYYKKTSKFFNSYYKWQPGEKNLYKLFLERFYYLCKSNGYLGIILPGGLLGEYYCKPLRQMLLTQINLEVIVEIVSNDEMFPDAEPGLSILILLAQKKDSKEEFLFIKGIRTIKDYISLKWNNRNTDSTKAVIFRKKDILKNSPRYIIPAVQNNIELQVLDKMTSFPSLSSNEWGCKTSRGLDMTNDKSLLVKKPTLYPLVEGRHLVRLGYDNTHPRYWIESIERYKEIVPFWDQVIIAWKNFSGNHRRRRMRIAILPPKTPISNSVICLYQLPNIPDVEYYLAGIMCSIPFEFRIRQLCYGLNINQYVVDSITVPLFDPIDKNHQTMVLFVKNFIPRGNEWAMRKMKASSSLSKAKLEHDYQDIITKIDSIAAQIYGFSRSEFEITLKAHPLLEPAYHEMALAYFELGT